MFNKMPTLKFPIYLEDQVLYCISKYTSSAIIRNALTCATVGAQKFEKSSIGC